MVVFVAGPVPGLGAGSDGPGGWDGLARGAAVRVAGRPDPGFGVLLRALREEARLTQEELAVAAGVSVRTVSDLERGVNRTARKATAVLLAAPLGLAGRCGRSSWRRREAWSRQSACWRPGRLQPGLGRVRARYGTRCRRMRQRSPAGPGSWTGSRLQCPVPQ